MFANLVAYAIHRVGNRVMCMARNIFDKRGSVDVAPRTLFSPGQPLRPFEDVVGN